MTYAEIAQRLIKGRAYYVGVRNLYADEQYEVGDSCRRSYEWDQENDCSTYETTGEPANGTCATIVNWSDEADDLAEEIARAIRQNFETYRGERQAIIAGDRRDMDAALDDGEVRIIDAEVIALVTTT